MTASDRICAALDFPSWQRAEPFARAIAPAVGMLTVGLELFTAEGPAVVRAAAALGRPVFEGVRIAEDGDMDVAQILVNVPSGGAYKGAAARARALEALEEFLAFALFEAKNRLPRTEAERLLREVGRMQVGKA